MENYFFSIAIYRFSEDAFYNKSETLRKKSGILPHSGNNLFDVSNAYDWEFNEIVGWLRLSFHFSQLQVNLFLYKHY